MVPFAKVPPRFTSRRFSLDYIVLERGFVVEGTLFVRVDPLPVDPLFKRSVVPDCISVVVPVFVVPLFIVPVPVLYVLPVPVVGGTVVVPVLVLPVPVLTVPVVGFIVPVVPILVG